MIFRRGLAAGALSVWLVGCAGTPTEAEPSTETQPIVDGEPSGADQDGVVLLRAKLDDGTAFLCTGSLVGKNLVMTARHCVSYFTDGQFSCSVRGELIDNPTGAGTLGLYYPAANIEIYGRKTPRKAPIAHGQQILSTLGPSICENDLAFIVLDTALDLPLVPMRLGRPAEVHEASLLVGYGMTYDDEPIDYRTQTRQQKRDLQIAAVGPDSIAEGVTTVAPRALVVLGPSGCIGDSGGPLLSEKTGAVLGVYSLQEGNGCSEPDIRHQLVHVPPFQALIEDAFKAAGTEPLLEPDPGSSGAGGAGGATDSDANAGGAQAANAAGGSDVAGVPVSGDDGAPSRSHSSCNFGPHSPSLPDLIGAFGGLAALLARRRAVSGAQRPA